MASPGVRFVRWYDLAMLSLSRHGCGWATRRHVSGVAVNLKKILLLVVLALLPSLPVRPDESLPSGAWLQDGVKWNNAPRDINPGLQAGGAAVIYFRRDHNFALIDCIVVRAPKEYMSISHGDPRGVYLGKWEVQGSDIAIEYRLVERTVQLTGEKLPGPVLQGTIHVSHNALSFERKTFRRSPNLDESAAEAFSAAQRAHPL